MKHEKFTTIAHHDHSILNPIASEKVDWLLGLLDLPAGARVLDAGCGKAEMLVRLVAHYGCAAIGVDTNPHFLAEARARAFERGAAGHLELREGDAATMNFPAGSFDAVLCVGATQAFGGYGSGLPVLRALVKPGGKLVVGEGYWMRKPDVNCLKALGAKLGDHDDHAGNVAAGLAQELIYLGSVVASPDDFDRYEGLYNRAVENWCVENPRDIDVKEARDKIRAWRDVYLRWGRETLGFAIYLFRK